MTDFEKGLRYLRWVGVCLLALLTTLALINLHPHVASDRTVAFATGLLMFATVSAFIASLIEIFKDDDDDER